MINLENVHIGTLLTYTTNRLWNDGSKDINENVKSIIEVTELFDNRFHYKTVEVLEANNVISNRTNVLINRTGGIFYNAINRLDLEIK